jgi:hypothetical protein
MEDFPEHKMRILRQKGVVSNLKKQPLETLCLFILGYFIWAI